MNRCPCCRSPGEYSFVVEALPAVGAGGFLVTSWEANRLALEMTTVVDAAAACLWLDPGVTEPAAMLERGFARVYGREARRAGRGGNRPGLRRCRFFRLSPVGESTPAGTCRPGRRPVDPLRAGGGTGWSGGPEALAVCPGLWRVASPSGGILSDPGCVGAAGGAGGVSAAAAGPPPDGPQPGLLRLAARSRALSGGTCQASSAAARAMWTSDSGSAKPAPGNEAILRKDKARWRQWTDWLRRVRGASPA